MNRIESAFNEIEESFRKVAEQNKKELDAALIKPIHDKFLFAQNGICAMIASMGSGKSYNYLKAIAKQEVLDPHQPFYELVVICSTSAKFDKTVETYKPLIKKSKLVCVKDSDLLFWLNKYMHRILKYNAIIQFVNNGCKDPNEELTRCFDKHRLLAATKNVKQKQLKYITDKLIKYDWKTCPHRCLLVLDDFANHPLLRSKETEMCRLLKKLRHFSINVIICVQTVKSIPKDIKRTLSDMILFPGKQDSKKQSPGKNNHREETIYQKKQFTRRYNHPEETIYQKIQSTGRNNLPEDTINRKKQSPGRNNLLDDTITRKKQFTRRYNHPEETIYQKIQSPGKNNHPEKTIYQKIQSTG